MATKYTREDRYLAAASFITNGNSKAASLESGIPASTIRHWANNDEDFQLICQEIRTEFGEKIKYKLAQIVAESSDQVLDRLRYGDFVLDTKTGKQVRVPMKGKDAAITGAIAFDKLRLAESQPTNIVQHKSGEEHNQRLLKYLTDVGKAASRGDNEEVERLKRLKPGELDSEQ